MQAPSGSIPGLRSAAKENFERLMTCVQSCNKLFGFFQAEISSLIFGFYCASDVRLHAVCSKLSKPQFPEAAIKLAKCWTLYPTKLTSIHLQILVCHWRSAMKSMTIAWCVGCVFHSHELDIPTHPVPQQTWPWRVQPTCQAKMIAQHLWIPPTKKLLVVSIFPTKILFDRWIESKMFHVHPFSILKRP